MNVAILPVAIALCNKEYTEDHIRDLSSYIEAEECFSPAHSVQG